MAFNTFISKFEPYKLLQLDTLCHILFEFPCHIDWLNVSTSDYCSVNFGRGPGGSL